MSTIMERLDKSLEEVARTVQSGFERGRLNLERTGLRRQRAEVAAKLGLLAWRKSRGQSIDEEQFESFCVRLDTIDEKLVRVDRDLAAARGETASVNEQPAPAAEEAEVVVEEEGPTQ